MSNEQTEQAVAAVGMMVAAFPNEDAGDQALKALKDAKKQQQIYYEDAAVIRQDADGGVTYHETGDMTTGKGAGIGALVGGVIGILGGPAGIVIGAGAGAIVGGAAAHGDAGFDDDSLETLGVALKPGTSAVALITSDQFLHAVRDQANEADMRAAVSEMGAELASKLDEGKAVALGMLLTEEGIAVTEIAADDDVTEVIGAVITEDGVVAGAAVVTEDGVAGVRAVSTEDGVAVQQAVVTDEVAATRVAVATEDEVVAGAVVAVPEDEVATEDAPAEEDKPAE